MHGNLTEIINTMTQVVLFGAPVALVLLLFFWNMSQLIFQSSNAEKMKDARARIFWSIIGMFVLFSLAGILVILQNTFFGSTNQHQGAVHSPTGGSPFSSGQDATGGASNSTTQDSAPGCAGHANPDNFCVNLSGGDPSYHCDRISGSCVHGNSLNI